MTHSGTEHESREAVVAKLRSLQEALHGHVAEAAVVQQQFIDTLRHSSDKTLYRPESTLDKLADIEAGLAEQAAFLRAPKRARGMLFLGERRFDRAGFAAHLLNKYGPAAPGQDPVEAAAQLIDQQIQQCQASSNRLISERGLHLSRARELQRHVARSIDLGLIERDNGVVTDIAACIWFCFEEGVLSKEHRRAAEVRARSLLSTEHITIVFARLLHAYRERIADRVGPLLGRRRCELYQNAARKRVEKLMHSGRQGGVQHGSEPGVRAIAGLRFVFACEQHLEPGRTPTSFRESCEAWIADASARELRHAIRVTLEQQILSESDFEVLRYVTPVRDAFLDVAGARRSTIAGNQLPV